MRLALLSALFAVFAASGTLAATPSDEAVKDSVAATAREVIAPAYRALADEAARLPHIAGRYCGGEEAALTAFREAFAQTALAWARIQYLAFGPIAPERRAARIAFFPDSTNAISRQLGALLAGDDPAALSVDAIASGSVALQGLSALERLILGDAVPAGGKECALAEAIAQNLASVTLTVADEWAPGETSFIGKIETTGPGSGAFLTDREPAERLLNDLLTGIVAMRDQKLIKPMGEDVAHAKPKQSEYWRSGLGSEALRANLAGITAILLAPGGFAETLEASGAGDVADGLRADLDAAKSAFDALPPALDAAMADDEARQSLVAAAATLGAIRDRLGGPVANSLGLLIGFNALDGD